MHRFAKVFGRFLPASELDSEVEAACNELAFETCEASRLIRERCLVGAEAEAVRDRYGLDRPMVMSFAAYRALREYWVFGIQLGAGWSTGDTFDDFQGKMCFPDWTEEWRGHLVTRCEALPDLIKNHPKLSAFGGWLLANGGN